MLNPTREQLPAERYVSLKQNVAERRAEGEARSR